MSDMNKIKVRNRVGTDLGRDEKSWAILDRVLRGNLNRLDDEMSFKQKYEGNKGPGTMD